LIQFETRIAKVTGEIISAAEAHKRIRDVLTYTGAIDGISSSSEAIYPYHNSGGQSLFEVLAGWLISAN